MPNGIPYNIERYQVTLPHPRATNVTPLPPKVMSYLSLLEIWVPTPAKLGLCPDSPAPEHHWVGQKFSLVGIWKPVRTTYFLSPRLLIPHSLFLRDSHAAYFSRSWPRRRNRIPQVCYFHAR